MRKEIYPLLLLLFITLAGKAQKSLNIFGGEDHDVYLGCLNCNTYSSSSIWNAYSTYGSKYNSNSIWNGYGQFGSAYSDLSPFNAYATHPPVIVDKDGNFYGYFTLNAYHDKRADFSLALTIYKYYDLIRDEPQKWYEKLFQ